MATWSQLTTFISSKYKITSNDGTFLKMLFSTNLGRSQVVFVSLSTTGAGAEFATIASPVATVGTVDIHTLLRETSEYIVGGVAIYGDLVVLRHAVPLADLDAGDFEVPLHLVVSAADAIEAKFVGTDAF